MYARHSCAYLSVLITRGELSSNATCVMVSLLLRKCFAFFIGELDIVFSACKKCIAYGFDTHSLSINRMLAMCLTAIRINFTSVLENKHIIN